LRINRGGHSLAAATLRRDLDPFCIFIPLSDALPRCHAPRVTPIMQIPAKTCAKETLKIALKTNSYESIHREGRLHRNVQPADLLMNQRVKRFSIHPAVTTIALFNQETFSSIFNRERTGSSEKSHKIYHPARYLILENSRKYMSGRMCSSGVESSSIFQTSSLLFPIQLLALMTFTAHTIPQL